MLKRTVSLNRLNETSFEYLQHIFGRDIRKLIFDCTLLSGVLTSWDIHALHCLGTLSSFTVLIMPLLVVINFENLIGPLVVIVSKH